MSSAESESGTEHVPATGMAAAFGKILGATLPQDDSGRSVILARRRAIERKLDEDEIDRRARRALRRDERLLRDKAHHPRPAVDNREKGLRKTATAGVVRLFNAMHALQAARRGDEAAAQREKEARLQAVRLGVADAADVAQGGAPPTHAAADVRALSKASFLELLKHGRAQ